MFTDDEKVRLREHAGYPVFGNQYELNARFYGEGFDVLEMNRRLEFALNNLQVAEESHVKTMILPQLDKLKKGIYKSRKNLDTARAAVWTHNANETNERRALYTAARLDLCGFLNVPAGALIRNGGSRMRV